MKIKQIISAMNPYAPVKIVQEHDGDCGWIKNGRCTLKNIDRINEIHEEDEAEHPCSNCDNFERTTFMKEEYCGESRDCPIRFADKTVNNICVGTYKKPYKRSSTQDVPVIEISY